jgi:hypothetical protein
MKFTTVIQLDSYKELKSVTVLVINFCHCIFFTCMFDGKIVWICIFLVLFVAPTLCSIRKEKHCSHNTILATMLCTSKRLIPLPYSLPYLLQLFS